MSKQQTKRSLAVLLIAAAVLVAGVTVAAWAKKGGGGGKPGGGGEEPRYTIVDLGALAPSTTHAYSINKWSQVVGESDGRAFLVTPEYDSDGKPVWFRDDDPADGINDLMIDLGTLGGHSSVALGINDLGQVVGRAFTGDDISTHHAFLITPEDTNNDGVPDTWFRDDNSDGINDLMIDLGTLLPLYWDDWGNYWGDCSVAYGINNSGHVVGYIPEGTNVDQGRAFIIMPEDVDGDGNLDWFADADGVNNLMIDLGTLGVRSSHANDVNDSGQVVGKSFGARGQLYRGFLITPADVDGDGEPDTWFRDVDGDEINDLMIVLGPLGGADNTCAAKAINASSQVVGWSKDNRGKQHAVLWEIDGQGSVTLTDLGKVKGREHTQAWDINDAGQVVGYGLSYGKPMGHVSYTAFLWEKGTMTKLIDLIANSEGIGDLTAIGINEWGEIVGTIYGDGYYHAYIAVPIP